MGKKNRILLIEDEEDTAVLIKFHAELLGFKLDVEVDGINGYRAVERERPDLVILDVMLPGENGLDVCRKIKQHPELKSIPVLILSAKDEELDIILGLELGADDYMQKPFSPKVLFSRAKAILRRSQKADHKARVVCFDEFTLDLDRYTLKKQNELIFLTLSEFGILRKLSQNIGQVFTRNQLLDELNHDNSFVVDRNIDVHIASLRKKLGPSFKRIETVRGIGYRFRELGAKKKEAIDKNSFQV